MHSLLKRTIRTLLSLCIVVLLAVPAMAGEALFQYSTIDALLAGLYEGDMPMQDLQKHGDFGLGTLNGIDGELVVLDGTAYHITAGGKATVPAPSALVPFATVSFFETESSIKVGAITSLKQLNATVLKELPSHNVFYAIRIDGDFSRVKTRAIPKQTPPYAPLHEVVKKQIITPFTGPGTLVGYYSPPFVKGVNVPGFHWHFLTKDRTGGGHVLDCALAPSTAKLDSLRSFGVALPDSPDFDALNLADDRGKALEAVEKDHPVKK